ncbi:MAG TPA: glutamate formimidoyltransferase [Blastocatellia bacterium]|nr:glutamate formimidoyltransferase [Blastocatellia bacterium]
MNKIVECIPNFSEGCDEAKIELIAQAIASVPDVFVLNQTMDVDHHRSVITFAGEPEAVVEAAMRAAETAIELIDLNRHSGAHPRIGALDVLPFVPIHGVTMDECVVLARHTGERVARELQIPVYLYEKAASRPERVDLADVRRGEFEGLSREIRFNPDRKPDYGESKIHPTAGAMAIGARYPLIAYNINLATENLGIAKKIAKAVRGRDGGLPYVKALAVDLKSRHQVQVSMNLVKYQVTPIFRVFEMVKREALRYGVNVAGSEIVGLIPQAALNACSEFYLQLENYDEGLVLEHRLQLALAESMLEPEPDDQGPAQVEIVEPVQKPIYQDKFDSPSIDSFALEVSAGTPIPDGGSVAAYAGALAASLGSMVCNLTIGQKATVEAEIRGALNQLEQLSEDLRLAMIEEEESRVRVLDALALPRETEAEKLARTSAIEDATRSAIAVPWRVANSAMEVLELLNELSEIGNPGAFANLAIGAQLAMAALRGAVYDVLSQLFSLNDEDFNRSRRADLSSLVTRGQELTDEIEALFFRLYPR